MAGSSIFVTYGLKSGGSAPFLKRTRTAFGQLETRTRTAANVQQLQARQRNCVNMYNAYGFSGSDLYEACNGYFGSCFTYNQAAQATLSCSNPGFSTYHCGCSSTPKRLMTCAWRGYAGDYTGWFNVGSCSTAYISPGCSGPGGPGYTSRQCQTVTQCQFGAFTAWSQTSSCTVATPSCSSGAVNRQCQTLFSFREEDWSAFEEVDECITSSPTATQGAVAVECIAN